MKKFKSKPNEKYIFAQKKDLIDKCIELDENYNYLKNLSKELLMFNKQNELKSFYDSKSDAFLNSLVHKSDKIEPLLKEFSFNERNALIYDLIESHPDYYFYKNNSREYIITFEKIRIEDYYMSQTSFFLLEICDKKKYEQQYSIYKRMFDRVNKNPKIEFSPQDEQLFVDLWRKATNGAYNLDSERKRYVKLSEKKADQKKDFMENIVIKDTVTGKITSLQYSFLRDMKNLYTSTVNYAKYIEIEATKQNLDIPLAVTVTTDGDIQPYSQGIFNEDFVRDCIHTAYLRINDFIKKMRVQLYRNGIKFKYLGVFEPTENHVPHFHFIIYLNQEDLDWAISVIKQKAVLSQLGEQLKIDHLYDVDENFEITDKNTSKAVNYLLKYFFKNLSTGDLNKCIEIETNSDLYNELKEKKDPIIEKIDEELDSQHYIYGWRTTNKIRRFFRHSDVKIPKTIYKKVGKAFKDSYPYFYDDVIKKQHFKNKESIVDSNVPYLGYLTAFCRIQKNYINLQKDSKVTHEPELDSYYSSIFKKYFHFIQEFKPLMNIHINYKTTKVSRKVTDKDTGEIETKFVDADVIDHLVIDSYDYVKDKYVQVYNSAEFETYKTNPSDPFEELEDIKVLDSQDDILLSIKIDREREMEVRSQIISHWQEKFDNASSKLEKDRYASLIHCENKIRTNNKDMHESFSQFFKHVENGTFDEYLEDREFKRKNFKRSQKVHEDLIPSTFYAF